MPLLPVRRLIRLLSPILFVATVCVAFFVIMGEAPTPEGEYARYLKFSTVTGYFQQDDPATDPKAFDYVSASSWFKLMSNSSRLLPILVS